MAARNGVEPWPLTHRKICCRRASQTAATSRCSSTSTPSSTTTSRHEHVLQLELPTSMRKAARRLARAAVRAMPGSKLTSRPSTSVLAALVRFTQDCRRPHHAVDVVIMACWFMLRGHPPALPGVRGPAPRTWPLHMPHLAEPGDDVPEVAFVPAPLRLRLWRLQSVTTRPDS